MSAILTFEHLDDFLLISDSAKEEIIPYRITLSPKTQTFSGVIEAKIWVYVNPPGNTAIHGKSRC